MSRELNNVVEGMYAAGVNYAEGLGMFERSYVLAVAERQKGNLNRMAAELGMHRNTLSALLGRLGITTALVRAHRKRGSQSIPPAPPIFP